MALRLPENMTSQGLIPAAVLGLQGALNAAFGIYGILRPLQWNAQLTDQFDGSIPIPAASTSSLQLLNMGIFTFFAATRPSLHRRGLIARVCVHLLAGYIFWDQGPKMRNAAMVEIGFATANAIAIPFVEGGGAL